MEKPQLKQSHLAFDGRVGFYQHQSRCCNASMRFSIFEPPQMEAAPVVYFLSGLTCTEENFVVKAGALKKAAELGLCLVVPDTSPRHTGIENEDSDWTYGSGAGFYLDATQEPWARHYKMYSYVVEELPELIQENFRVSDRMSLMGHSMGGHGALVLGLRNPHQYRSMSAFAPIANPSASPWTQQAFSYYLGDSLEQWQSYDATVLVEEYRDERTILVDQGLADQFLADLRPEAFEAACTRAQRPLKMRRHQGYDHGYHFIATFIDDHLHHHAQALR
ncbi:MAG: S-formylglutathione hydrolase [Cyanobacteria bacterium P01_F01_bin.42]